MDEHKDFFLVFLNLADSTYHPMILLTLIGTIFA